MAYLGNIRKIKITHQNCVSLFMELLPATSSTEMPSHYSTAVSFQSFWETSLHPCYFPRFSVLTLFDCGAPRYVKVRSATALAESRSPTHLKFG